HQREHDEHLHQHRQRVLRAHHAAVEERERWHAHHQHQGRRGEHPGDVALVGCGGGLRLLLLRFGGGGLRLGGWLVGGRGRLVLRERYAREGHRQHEREECTEFLHHVLLRAPPHRSRRCGCE